MLKNAKPLRIPIPWKGQLGFFNVELPKIKNKKIIIDVGTLKPQVLDIIRKNCLTINLKKKKGI